jgi:hypothetical protein
VLSRSLRSRLHRVPRAVWTARGRWSRLSAAVGITLAGACTRFEAAAATVPFRLTHIRPSNPEGLFLNEELVFYFSEEIDPTSVTGASVEILSADGRLAHGALQVEIDKVRFVPAPVLERDLSDGGYLPDTRYTVTLAGFPRPEGLRSAKGAVLEKTRTWSFHTVHVSQPRSGLVFEDRMQDRVGFLRLFPAAGGQGGLIGTQDPIYLACDKPLDPSSVREEAFRLRSEDSLEDVGVRVRVVENHAEAARRPRPATVRSSASPEAWERERRACLIEVTPEHGLRRSGGTWMMSLMAGAADRDPLLRDFGGKPVLCDAPSSTFPILVRDAAADAGRPTLREEFTTTLLRSPVALPGYDGTAFWGDTGRVEVRYPAAAGSGADGAVALGGSEERTDVQALSIELVEGESCSLSPKPGLVALRCQGRMSIRGTLTREQPGDAQRETAGDPTLARWAELSRPGSNKPSDETLSEWLARARAADWNWTVLIAGGDLSIEKSLSTTTPLLLVAGGTIRVTGSVRGTGAVGAVFLLRCGGVGVGGGFDIFPPPTTSPVLVVDEPQGANPLARGLRFAALSGPIPPRGAVLRWLPPEVGGRPEKKGLEGRAGWRVRYLRELSGSPRVASDLASVDSPLLLDPPGPLQFLIELEIEPGGIWDPPWVDYVHLAWEQPALRPGSTGSER